MTEIGRESATTTSTSTSVPTTATAAAAAASTPAPLHAPPPRWALFHRMDCAAGCTAQCGSTCIWKRYPPVSVPISTIYKASLTTAEDNPKEDSKTSNDDGVSRDHVSLFTLSLACKTCRTLDFEVHVLPPSEFTITYDNFMRFFFSVFFSLFFFHCFSVSLWAFKYANMGVYC